MLNKNKPTFNSAAFPANLFLTAFLFALLPSCTVTRQSAYFKTLNKDTTLRNFVSNDFESQIIKGDRLAIAASSNSAVEDALFNGTQALSSSAGSGTSGGGYTVDANGNIFLHRIGSVKAEGFTRRELAKSIETKLLAYMKDPIVQVTYLNHKVTVLGEVSKPQVLSMPEEQISLLDALVLSGDVTPNANRRAVKIIREDGNTKKVKHINLEDHSLFSSEWYYVKPNDIIMVNADTERFEKEEKRRQLQTNLSLAASGIGLLVIIIDRVVN